MSRIVFLLFFICSAAFDVHGKICDSMRIMNDVTYLERLRGCTQIWGSLEIILIHRTEHAREFDRYVFPELKQINGYLLFYAVTKLTSIGRLFPELRAIRGMELMMDYSLVIFGMEDLKEIGTTNLLFIGRGYVKVDRCPLLCYVNTVNWEKLGDNVKLHYNAMIESDKEEKEMESQGCERCPAVCGGYCWNAMHCQDLEADKCHEECLGCYKEQSPRHCDACKNYEYNGECVPECPPGTYNHTISNKCVTEEQCRSNMDNILKGSWWLFGRECVSDCPGDYHKATNANGQFICEFCGTDCTRHCNVTEDVNAMDKLQKLKGCTHIQGSLAIRLFNIDPRKIIGDLSGYLGSIRYIRDSLIIGRSEGITTLAVLKNLRMIEGKHLDNKYALFVYDNPNLQQLWNFSDPSFKLEIKNGTVAFHDNPLLCVSEIIKLANVTGMNYSQVDVSMYSNGDKAACNKTDIAVEVDVQYKEVYISWKEKPCHGQCIGYTLFYRIAKMNETVTTFDSNDVCIDNAWNSTFTSKTSIVLRKLKAYTRHAFYIKIYHEKSIQGSQSGMMYFVTKPDAPGDPENLRAHAINSHTITVKWKRPVDVNGNLSKYIIDMDMEEDQTDLRSLRNYCDNPWSQDGTAIDRDSKLFQTDPIDNLLITLVPENNTYPDRNRCFCKTKKKPVVEYFKQLEIFNRDITLHNCDDHGLSKFGYDECRDYKYRVVKSNESRIPYNVEKRSESNLLDNVIYVPSNMTAINILNLKHFTMYVFYLSACNEINGMYNCSGVEQTFERTVRKEDADDVHDVEVHIQDSNVHITWSEPKNPNSMILAYKIIYNETSTENSAPITTCIPRDDKFNGSSWVLNYLSPGTYLIKVQAVSLAGPGRESEEISFVIALPRKLTTTVILWVCVTLVAIFLVGLIVYFWWKRKHPPITFRDINPEYHGLQYEPDDWEVERSDIELDSNLGRGTFGTVYYGKIKSKNIIVAVKTANENKDRMEFLNEASVMKSFSNCHHVVRLYGVVSIGEPPLVIMELMERGDLKKYLHRTRESSHSLTSPEIYRMAVEIADGMAYLAAKKFVHRDLAARNCMVASDRTVKIGDFGMARDIYETDYYKKGTKGLLPVRWMAPESLADGVFTSDSDVWSYGIVLWEISTLAEQPYQGMSNEQVLQFVVSKGRLERPQECSDLFYEVMRQCWCWRPIDRPTFWDIVEKLEDHVGENFKVVSFIHSREGNEHKIIHGRTRIYNAPAICMERDEDLIGHYNVSEDEISLHVGTAPNRPSFLQSSLSQSRDSRISPSDFY